MYLKRALIIFVFLFVVAVTNSCDLEGPAGLNSIVHLTTELPGANCKNGGVRIESGLDANRDEQLASEEVNQVQYVCNGANGSVTTISSEPVGSSCPYGGFKISTGIDSNFNQNLDVTEINSTQYICAVGTDKQIRLPFPSGASTRSTSYVVSDHQIPQLQYLVKFNKADYANVSGIKFGATLTAGIDPMNVGISTTNTASVELFNVTDNVAIANSELQVTANGATKTLFVESGDLSASLPAKEIQLLIRIKTSDANHSASVGSAYVFVYKM